MPTAPTTEPQYKHVDGVMYELLGPNDTRTATHFLCAGRAYQVG